MVTVKVMSQSSGKPVSGKRVKLSFDSGPLWIGGGLSREERTDSQGEAHFDNDPGNGKVYVDGRTAHEGRLAGRVVVYV